MSAPSNAKLFLTALGITEVFWALAGVAIMLITQPLDQALHYWWVFQIACLAIGAVSQTAIWLLIAGESTP